MLDLAYLALVVAPLTIAAAALLVMAVRSFRTHSDARLERRRAEIAVAQARPGGMRKKDAPLEEPASIASLGDVRSLGTQLVASLANDPRPERDKPSLEELSALVEALAHPPREAPRPTEIGASVMPPPAVRVGAGPVATKHCPDCAEEILAAARVCKHCRYRFEERGGEERLSA
jgi:hypothetical protein